MDNAQQHRDHRSADYHGDLLPLIAGAKVPSASTLKLTALLASVTLALAACANGPNTDSTSSEIAAAAFRANGPPSITLFTMVNNSSGAGGHTSLMINASQRVIFDPAGSFRDPRVVESGDVIYGMTPAWEQAYRSAHARAAFHVVTQTVTVTPELAERALRLVQANGPVGAAFCAQSTSGILRQLDGFESIRQTFYPVNLQEQFERLPGVRTDRYYENDEGDIVDGVAQAVASVE